MPPLPTPLHHCSPYWPIGDGGLPMLPSLLCPSEPKLDVTQPGAVGAISRLPLCRWSLFETWRRQAWFGDTLPSYLGASAFWWDCLYIDSAVEVALLPTPTAVSLGPPNHAEQLFNVCSYSFFSFEMTNNCLMFLVPLLFLRDDASR